MDKLVSVIYSPDARKDIKKLDKKEGRRVVLKIKENTESPNPLQRAKALSGILSGYYRYRIGDYRAIFSWDEKGQVSILKILRVKHRKDVYRM
ncbi:MAG TPA: type II toxin-antitoxin system RelE/ParE family toxin [Candidatus Paceibacterota bacterium]|nr:type II toxin-antitoxin system RelE/ParE family toxin [Candidatus Paceibacterota bacterium]HMO82690.1 type II toxin-antitoxin system RelE/ParE family toxin [Candidatus Paceibacterota bacterium]